MTMIEDTLNKKTPTKIRTDLKVIFAGEAKPETVYYFCEPNVPVATRHKLQDECKTAYNADLVIFDGLAIADQLADAATFWIAQHFLSVPSEFFPEETGDDGYTERRAKWLAGTAVPLTLAEFLDVKYGLRATIDEDYAKADLAGWTALMRSVVEIHPNLLNGSIHGSIPRRAAGSLSLDLQPASNRQPLSHFKQWPPRDFRFDGVRTTAICFAHQDSAEIPREDRILACYQHCAFLCVSNKAMLRFAG